MHGKDPSLGWGLEVAGDVFSLEGQGPLTLSRGTVLTSTEQDPPPAPRIWGPQPQAPSCWRMHHASSSLGAGGFNGAAWEQQLREQVAAPGAGQAHLALHLGTHLPETGQAAASRLPEKQPPLSLRPRWQGAGV